MQEGDVLNYNNYSDEQNKIAEQIKEIYYKFGVEVGKIVDITEGPRVTRFEFQLPTDTKISKITMLRDDISLMLSVPKLRIICPIPSKTTFAIEIPNKSENFVMFDAVYNTDIVKNSSDKLSVSLGKNISNENIFLNLSKAPHLLIGGSEYSGKTTLLKNIATALICNNTPDELKLLLTAPQKDELQVFEGSKHLLSPIICNADMAIEALNNLVNDCEERIKLFTNHSVRCIDDYNNVTDNKLKKIVVIIDEISFLTAYKLRDFETIISRICQIGRMAGIHVILSTKNLTSKNITGIIKANIPTRIALSVRNAVESRTIIDACDAECLLLKGDLLLCDSIMNKPQRIQAVYITDERIKDLISD